MNTMNTVGRFHVPNPIGAKINQIKVKQAGKTIEVKSLQHLREILLSATK